MVSSAIGCGQRNNYHIVVVDVDSSRGQCISDPFAILVLDCNNRCKWNNRSIVVLVCSNTQRKWNTSLIAIVDHEHNGWGYRNVKLINVVVSGSINQDY